jgi:hypothetical protein
MRPADSQHPNSMQQWLATNMKTTASTAANPESKIPALPSKPKRKKGDKPEKSFERVHANATLAIADELDELSRHSRLMLGALMYTVLTAPTEHLTTPAATWTACLHADNQGECTWASLTDALSKVPRTESMLAHQTVLQQFVGTPGIQLHGKVFWCKVARTYKQDRFKVQWWVDTEFTPVGNAIAAILLSLDPKTEIHRDPPPRSLKSRVRASRIRELRDLLD